MPRHNPATGTHLGTITGTDTTAGTVLVEVPPVAPGYAFPALLPAHVATPTVGARAVVTFTSSEAVVIAIIPGR